MSDSGKSRKAYEDAIATNEVVVRLIVQYQDIPDGTIPDEAILANIFELIRPTSVQICVTVQRKLTLPFDVLDDMLQDAFMKLHEALTWNFKPERCPVFLTFWRRALHNDLLSKYYSRWRHYELIEVEDNPEEPPDLSLGEALTTLQKNYLAEVSTWKDVALATSLLNERIFQLPENATSQKEIAARFKRTQGFISQWEKWLRNKIKSENQDLIQQDTK